MSNGNRRRMRRAGASMPKAPEQSPQPVLPRGGNGVPTRRRVQDALSGRPGSRVQREAETIPVDPASRPRARSSQLAPTDALVSSLQQVSQVLEDGLGAVEDILEDLLQVARVATGLTEADEELGNLRAEKENLEVENAHLNQQLASLHAQLEQIRQVIPTAEPDPAPSSTPPASSSVDPQASDPSDEIEPQPQ